MVMDSEGARRVHPRRDAVLERLHQAVRHQGRVGRSHGARLRIVAVNGCLGYGFEPTASPPASRPAPQLVGADAGLDRPGPVLPRLGHSRSCARRRSAATSGLALTQVARRTGAAGRGLRRHGRRRAQPAALQADPARDRARGGPALQARDDPLRDRQGARARRRAQRRASRRWPTCPSSPSDAVMRQRAHRRPDGHRAVREGARSRRRRGAHRPLVRHRDLRGAADRARLRSRARAAHGEDHGVRRAVRDPARAQRQPARHDPQATTSSCARSRSSASARPTASPRTRCTSRAIRTSSTSPRATWT